MANTYEKFTTTGQTVFTLPFSSNYLLKSHVKVYKGRDLLLETQTATLSEGTDYTFSSTTQITLSTGLASGEELTIQRQTPEASQLSPWNDGSNLTAEALNKADLQCLYVVQEQSDLNALNAAKAEASKTTANTASTNASNAVSTANAALPKAGGSMTGPIAMGTNKITGLGDPTAAQDAVTKAYLERTGSIQSAQIQDGTLVNDDVNASAAIAQSKLDIANATTSASGYMSAADKTKLDSCDTGAKDDQTASEIRALVDSATNSNVYTDAEKTKLSGIDTGAKDDQTASEIKALYEDSGNNNAAYIKTTYESNAQTNALTDAEKAVIDGVVANTSEINNLSGYTGNTANLNIVAGKTFRASTDGALTTTSDTEMPSSKVVANHVAAQIGTVGGFTTIANDASFPATASQPATGVIISISDAQGIVVSGTTSTTGRTVDGTPATVTINNFPSSLTGETLASGVGLLVTSTGSGNIYNYHKLLAAESDVKQLSDDINDFNARYRIAASAPGSNNDDGDLWFDSTSKKMKVYNATTSQYDDVASVGSFYVNTISSSSGTGGGSATFNDSAYRFTLSNAGTSAQQHIVSVNGVIQKPNSGTSQPSEGFAIDGNDIIFSAAPAANSDFFIITCGSSVSIGTPSANSVNSSHIIDGSIVNGDISNSANISGLKLADDSIPEAKLDVHNAPATDKYLKYTSNGMEWSDGASEGTDVKSTGESGTTKFLRTDGDGTSSWQPVPSDTTKANVAGQDFTGVVALKGATQLQFYDAGDYSNYIHFKAPSLTANTTYTLPAADGSTDQVLKTDGSGALGWTTIEAAPTITGVANGSIANNKPVIVKSDAKLEQVAEDAAGGGTAFLPNGTDHSDQSYYKHEITMMTSDKFALCYLDENNYPCARIGTIDRANMSATIGSETILTSTASMHPRVVYDDTNSVLVWSWWEPNKIMARVGHSISGTGQTVAPEQTIFDGCYFNDCVYEKHKDIYIWAFNEGTSGMDGLKGQCAEYNSSATTKLTLANDHTADLTDNGSGANRLARMIQLTTSGISNGQARVGMFWNNNQSGTDGTWYQALQIEAITHNSKGAQRTGNTVSVASGKYAMMGIANYVDDGNEHRLMVAAYQDGSQMKLKTYSLNTAGHPSLQSTTSFNSSGDTGDFYFNKIPFDRYNKEFILVYKFTPSGGSASLVMQTIKFNPGVNYTPTFGPKVTIDDSTDPDEPDTIWAGAYGETPASNIRALHVFRDEGNNDYLTGVVFRTKDETNLTTGFVGFSDGAYTNGQTAKIKVVGNTTTQSSLTPGTKYYVQGDGTLGTTAVSPSVEAGTALSSTKLLIKG